MSRASVGCMNAQARLRQAIDQQQDRLRASLPREREAALCALVGVRDRLAGGRAGEVEPDLVSGRRLADLGGNMALQLVLEAREDSPAAAPVVAGDGLEAWAAGLLAECERLAAAELVLGHCET